MNVEERAVYGDIGRKGLWENNTALVQLLGLCPLLAVSNSLVNAVSLSLATVLVMALASGAVAALRTLIPHEIRIPVFILIIAALVTCLDLAFNAWLHDLYLVLGIFIPLIVTNCIVLARVEAFAAKNSPLAAAWDGAAMGAGLLWVLALLGGMRELVGTGTLFAGIDTIIPGAREIRVFGEEYRGLLMAILPPGAFIFLGLLIAARNAWVAAVQARTPPQQAPAQAAST